MKWWRDAKFGMFIHWGPCSVGKKEIGWGRNANRPWDINKHGPRTSDPIYDNYYKKFNPVKYDADEWVTFAKESGMKYMVIITKHHDGFTMFDSKVTEYDIMESPYGKDIIKQFADACHNHEMRFGFYYSTRDWYHPDYLVGDNKKYDKFYRTQIEELMINYGDVDVMWFDHIGGQDWSKWRFDKLFAMIYRLQTDIIVNNRGAKFCGRGKAAKPKVKPVSKEIREMTRGDFVTPEGRIGRMNLKGDWESCIHVGRGWAYRGESGFKGPKKCIEMLVSCTTGGGNLLLNFGPRPDGTFTDGETKVAVAMGNWLDRYGAAIYGTRGGPYQNGNWGGSCHKDKKLYLHVYKFKKEKLELPALGKKVLSARILGGEEVACESTDDALVVTVPKEQQDSPVTVIELTLDEQIKDGTVIK